MINETIIKVSGSKINDNISEEAVNIGVWIDCMNAFVAVSISMLGVTIED